MSAIAAAIWLALGWDMQRLDATAFLQYAHAVHFLLGARRLDIDHVAAIVMLDLADHIAHCAAIVTIVAIGLLVASLLAPARWLGQHIDTGCGQYQ